MLYDYTEVTTHSVGEAVDDGIAAAEELVGSIIAADGPRTWDNSLQPLNEMTAVISEANGRGPFMARVHPDEEVRNAANQ